jgi:hypothetical protein
MRKVKDIMVEKYGKEISEFFHKSDKVELLFDILSHNTDTE